MRPLRAVLILACVLVCSACGDARQRAEREIRRDGGQQLRRDAARLYMQVFTAHGRPDFVDIWYKDWPRSIQQIAPLHVGAYHDGISIALSANDRGESGLYVVPESMDHVPASTSGVSFQKVADGIYWYSFSK
ncbi:MAG TPA: hypothetical protein VEO95_00005, partial [Chthoniobacteraceae bacterium]|nr:hypothetical protein [Chthoniobacteraceae bacterium]